MKEKSSFFSIIVFFILLILCGLSLINFLNFELNPQARSSSLSVNFSWYGAEPRIIEQEVTSKLEALFAQVKGIKEISSKSGNEGGIVVLTLDKDADPDLVRFEISSLIRQAFPEMPNGITYPVLKTNLPDEEEQRPLITYNLNAPQNHPVVQQYADDHIKTVLSQIRGVNNIEIYGASPFDWFIEYEADKIKSIGISYVEIQQAISFALKKEYNVVQMSNGIVIPVTLQTKYLTGTNILDIPIKKSGERIIYLRDIATIKHLEGQPSNFYRINGLNTINILIYSGLSENNIVVGKKVKKAMQQLSITLPPDYELLLSDDSTEYMRHEMYNLGLRFLCTFLILLGFILAATRKVKHVLLIFIMLIGNLSISVILYYLFHLEIHLYALAGITVSLGLMTDNIIIMSDHLRNHGNRKAFLAILAGTLATVSSLVIIFFLEEQFRTNLIDFALVIIINQSVSMITALFVIPALMNKFKIDKVHLQLERGSFNKGIPSRRRQVFIIRLTYLYRNVFLFLRKRKVIAIFVFLLGFGLPVYMLPDKWEGDKWYSKAYNITIGNEWYKTNSKPWVDKIFGGALRLFTEKIYNNSYFEDLAETSLFVTAMMPRGSTLLQANNIVLAMEAYLKQFNEIKIFQTNVTSRNAYLNIYFTKESMGSAFPRILKGGITAKAIDLGSADWSIFGIGTAFNNSVDDGAGSYAIKLLGYNYDQLILLAGALKEDLILNPRITQVYILSEISWFKPDNIEFVSQVNREQSVITNKTSVDIYEALQSWSLTQPAFASIITSRGRENIRLRPQKLTNVDIWSLSHNPLLKDTVMFKFNEFTTIVKEVKAPIICRKDQQYQAYLQFDYVGSEKIAWKYIDNIIDNLKHRVPVGYYISTENAGRYSWSSKDKNQYWFLILIAIMIFFICAVLFESLSQPFAVILTIPVGYIGLFLTFYLFDINFDQGGFAALVMLSGITGNAAIYILNDYNHLRKHFSGRNISDITLYFKAFNYKIIPILLTILSTILGFVPFLIGEKQPFWFALAAGTIGGLLFSLLGIIFYLPLFLKSKELKNEVSKMKNSHSIITHDKEFD